MDEPQYQYEEKQSSTGKKILKIIGIIVLIVLALFIVLIIAIIISCRNNPISCNCTPNCSSNSLASIPFMIGLYLEYAALYYWNLLKDFFNS